MSSLQQLFRSGLIGRREYAQLLAELFAQQTEMPEAVQILRDERHIALERSLMAISASRGGVIRAVPTRTVGKNDKLSSVVGSAAPGTGLTRFATPAWFFGHSPCEVRHPNWVGDGYCDKSAGYNTAACMWDGGDCCPETCVGRCRASFACQPGAVGDYFEWNPVVITQLAGESEIPMDETGLVALHVWTRTRLGRGCGRLAASFGGDDLTEPEWRNVRTAFNRGTIVYPKTSRYCCSGSACGNKASTRDMYKCGGTRGPGECFGGGAGIKHDGVEWSYDFGTGVCLDSGPRAWTSNSPFEAFRFTPRAQGLMVHEVAHNAGYTHPAFGPDVMEWGPCLFAGPGRDYCPGASCKKSSSACGNPFASSFDVSDAGGPVSRHCGFRSCQARCVTAEMSRTIPEKAVWCLRILDVVPPDFMRGVYCKGGFMDSWNSE